MRIPECAGQLPGKQTAAARCKTKLIAGAGIADFDCRFLIAPDFALEQVSVATIIKLVSSTGIFAPPISGI